MHASTWHFAGDPDDLLVRYGAMVDEIPDEQFVLHVCLRTDDGILIVDTCPSEATYRSFVASDWFNDLLARHGMGRPELRDYPVVRAYARGVRVDG